MTNQDKEIEFNFKIEDMIDTQSIAKNVAAKLNEDVANTVIYNVRQHVENTVSEILKPEIEKLVACQRDNILKELTKAMPLIGAALAEKAVATANENLSSYYGKEILRKLFGA